MRPIRTTLNTITYTRLADAFYCAQKYLLAQQELEGYGWIEIEDGGHTCPLPAAITDTADQSDFH